MSEVKPVDRAMAMAISSPASAQPDPQIQALMQLPRDLAVVKIENDQIMAMAAAHPRDHGKILANLKAQLATYRFFAEGAIYRKPVAKDEKGNKKYATGLSIRAAEALAEAYGFNKCRVTTQESGPDHAKVTATFTDLQNCRSWETEKLVPKTYKDRYGAQKRISDDRFYEVVVPAHASKAIRDSILRCMPAGLKAELMDAAETAIDEFLDEGTVKKMIANFGNKGVTQEQLEQYLDKPCASWNKGDRKTMMQTWRAIEDEETTVADVFGGSPPPAAPEQTKTEALAKKVAEAGK